MTINGINISTYKAELIQRIISTETKNSITGWYDEALDGALLAQLKDFRRIKLTFYLDADSEDAAYKLTSQLIEEIKVSAIKFDDIDLTFECYLDGSFEPERAENGKFKLTVELKNSLAKGTEQTVSFDITAITARKLTVNYYRNWETTVNYYNDAFEDSDLHELIKSEDVYVSTTEPTATSYNAYALALGIDLDKYQEANEQPGRINISTDYDATTAASLTSIDVYYDRIQMDGYDDIPSGKDFPTSVFSFDSDNTKYFSIPIPTDTLVDDVSVEVTGRWYDQLTDNQLFAIDGANDNDLYALKSSKLNTGASTSPVESTVYTSSNTGNTFILVTYEDISSVPMRKHALVSSNRGASKQSGFYSIVFNGVTLARKALSSLVAGTTSSAIKLGIAKNFDLARVRVYIQDELVHDLIPIASSVKNCFVNNFDDGLYDVQTFDFIPWTGGSTSGAAPSTPMVKPEEGAVDPGPVIVAPTDPSVMWLYKSVDDINNDDLSGKNAVCKSSSATDYASQDWEPSALDEDTFYVLQPVPNQSFSHWTLSNSTYASMVTEHKDSLNRWYLECKAAHAGYLTVSMTDSSSNVIGSAYFHIKSY